MIIRKEEYSDSAAGMGGVAEMPHPELTEVPVTQTVRAAMLLRQMLLRGDFKPGERLREIPLAEHVGVSRIPLRLALEQLAHEGLLELRATRGFVAQEFSLSDVYDAIELRASLEGTAAQLAAERSTGPDSVVRLYELNQQMLDLIHEKPLDMNLVLGFGELNAEWHNELVRLSQSRLVRRSFDQVCALPFAAPSAFIRQDFNAPQALFALETAMQQHKDMADAIVARDGEKAAEVARAHARLAHLNLKNALKDPQAGENLPSLKMIRLKTTEA